MRPHITSPCYMCIRTGLDAERSCPLRNQPLAKDSIDNLFLDTGSDKKVCIAKAEALRMLAGKLTVYRILLLPVLVISMLTWFFVKDPAITRSTFILFFASLLYNMVLFMIESWMKDRAEKALRLWAAQAFAPGPDQPSPEQEEIIIHHLVVGGPTERPEQQQQPEQPEGEASITEASRDFLTHPQASRRYLQAVRNTVQQAQAAIRQDEQQEADSGE